MSDTPPESAPVDQPEWAALQDKAGNFSLLASVFALAFVVFALAAFFTGSANLGMIAAGSLGASLWLYQSAQLLHIRALLQKNSPPPPAAPASSPDQR